MKPILKTFLFLLIVEFVGKEVCVKPLLKFCPGLVDLADLGQQLSGSLLHAGGDNQPRLDQSAHSGSDILCPLCAGLQCDVNSAQRPCQLSGCRCIPSHALPQLCQRSQQEVRRYLDLFKILRS